MTVEEIEARQEAAQLPYKLAAQIRKLLNVACERFDEDNGVFDSWEEVEEKALELVSETD